MKEKKDIIDSIAYCGLICGLCFKTKECDGCKQTASACKSNYREEGCYQRKCCREHKLSGCWECVQFPCHKGIYNNDNNPKIKAFAYCIKEDGIDKFIEYVLVNKKRGLNCEKGKDYDFKPIDEVLLLLRTGQTKIKK